MSDLLWFRWERHCDGYRVVNTDDGQYLEPRSEATETYDPFTLGTENLALFQIFADTPETAEGIENFASRYGLFDRDCEGPLSIWEPPITSMRIATDAWRRGDINDVVHLIGGARSYGQTTIELVNEKDAERPTIRIVPQSLRDALWYQLALTISCGRKVKNCDFCQMPFFYGPGTNRRETAAFCSPKCQRHNAYAKRLEAKK